MVLPAAAPISSSASTKGRSSLALNRRPTDVFPQPIRPTMTSDLLPSALRIVSARSHAVALCCFTSQPIRTMTEAGGSTVFGDKWPLTVTQVSVGDKLRHLAPDGCNGSATPLWRRWQLG